MSNVFKFEPRKTKRSVRFLVDGATVVEHIEASCINDCKLYARSKGGIYIGSRDGFQGAWRS